MVSQSAVHTDFGIRSHRVKASALVVAMAALLVVLALVDPSTHTLVTCPFHLVSGLQCAGCGMTRAAHELLHGRVWQAMQMNVLSVIVLPLIAVGMMRYIHALWNDTKPVAVRVPRGARVSALLILLVYIVLRNIR